MADSLGEEPGALGCPRHEPCASPSTRPPSIRSPPLLVISRRCAATDHVDTAVDVGGPSDYPESQTTPFSSPFSSPGRHRPEEEPSPAKKLKGAQGPATAGTLCEQLEQEGFEEGDDSARCPQATIKIAPHPTGCAKAPCEGKRTHTMPFCGCLALCEAHHHELVRAPATYPSPPPPTPASRVTKTVHRSSNREARSTNNRCAQMALDKKKSLGRMLSASWCPQCSAVPVGTVSKLGRLTSAT